MLIETWRVRRGRGRGHGRRAGVLDIPVGLRALCDYLDFTGPVSHGSRVRQASALTALLLSRVLSQQFPSTIPPDSKKKSDYSGTASRFSSADDAARANPVEAWCVGWQNGRQPGDILSDVQHACSRIHLHPVLAALLARGKADDIYTGVSPSISC